jgi:hypothetical protein
MAPTMSFDCRSLAWLDENSEMVNTDKNAIAKPIGGGEKNSLRLKVHESCLADQYLALLTETKVYKTFNQAQRVAKCIEK